MRLASGVLAHGLSPILYLLELVPIGRCHNGWVDVEAEQPESLGPLDLSWTGLDVDPAVVAAANWALVHLHKLVQVLDALYSLGASRNLASAVEIPLGVRGCVTRG